MARSEQSSLRWRTLLFSTLLVLAFLPSITATYPNSSLHQAQPEGRSSLRNHGIHSRKYAHSHALGMQRRIRGKESVGDKVRSGEETDFELVRKDELDSIAAAALAQAGDMSAPQSSAVLSDVSTSPAEPTTTTSTLEPPTSSSVIEQAITTSSTLPPAEESTASTTSTSTTAEVPATTSSDVVPATTSAEALSSTQETSMVSQALPSTAVDPATSTEGVAVSTEAPSATVESASTSVSNAQTTESVMESPSSTEEAQTSVAQVPTSVAESSTSTSEAVAPTTTAAILTTEQVEPVSTSTDLPSASTGEATTVQEALPTSVSPTSETDAAPQQSTIVTNDPAVPTSTAGPSSTESFASSVAVESPSSVATAVGTSEAPAAQTTEIVPSSAETPVATSSASDVPAITTAATTTDATSIAQATEPTGITQNSVAQETSSAAVVIVETSSSDALAQTAPPSESSVFAQPTSVQDVTSAPPTTEGPSMATTESVIAPVITQGSTTSSGEATATVSEQSSFTSGDAWQSTRQTEAKESTVVGSSREVVTSVGTKIGSLSGSSVTSTTPVTSSSPINTALKQTDSAYWKIKVASSKILTSAGGEITSYAFPKTEVIPSTTGTSISSVDGVQMSSTATQMMTMSASMTRIQASSTETGSHSFVTAISTESSMRAAKFETQTIPQTGIGTGYQTYPSNAAQTDHTTSTQANSDSKWTSADQESTYTSYSSSTSSGEKPKPTGSTGAMTSTGGVPFTTSNQSDSPSSTISSAQPGSSSSASSSLFATLPVSSLSHSSLSSQSSSQVPSQSSSIPQKSATSSRSVLPQGEKSTSTDATFSTTTSTRSTYIAEDVMTLAAQASTAVPSYESPAISEQSETAASASAHPTSSTAQSWQNTMTAAVTLQKSYAQATVPTTTISLFAPFSLSTRIADDFDAVKAVQTSSLLDRTSAYSSRLSFPASTAAPATSTFSDNTQTAENTAFEAATSVATIGPVETSQSTAPSTAGFVGASSSGTVSVEQTPAEQTASSTIVVSDEGTASVSSAAVATTALASGPLLSTTVTSEDMSTAVPTSSRVTGSEIGHTSSLSASSINSAGPVTATDSEPLPTGTATDSTTRISSASSGLPSTAQTGTDSVSASESAAASASVSSWSSSYTEAFSATSSYEPYIPTATTLIFAGPTAKTSLSSASSQSIASTQSITASQTLQTTPETSLVMPSTAVIASNVPTMIVPPSQPTTTTASATISTDAAQATESSGGTSSQALISILLNSNNYPWQFVVNNSEATSQLFITFPEMLSTALIIDQGSVKTYALQAYSPASYDGASTELLTKWLGYIPAGRVNDLAQYIKTPSSPLYNQPGIPGQLALQIDSSYPLIGSTSASTDGSATSAASESHSDNKRRDAIIGACVGIGGALWIALAVWIYRRVKRNHDAKIHRRLSERFSGADGAAYAGAYNNSRHSRASSLAASEIDDRPSSFYANDVDNFPSSRRRRSSISQAVRDSVAFSNNRNGEGSRERTQSGIGSSWFRSSGSQSHRRLSRDFGPSTTSPQMSQNPFADIVHRTYLENGPPTRSQTWRNSMNGRPVDKRTIGAPTLQSNSLEFMGYK